MKNWAWYTLSAHALNYVPLAVKKGCAIMGAICRFSREERVEHSIAIFSSQSTRRGSRDVLEAFFAVKVEAGDGHHP